MEEKMTLDQAIIKIEALEAELKSSKESNSFWMDEKYKVEKKFNAFRDAVKGLVVLVD